MKTHFKSSLKLIALGILLSVGLSYAAIWTGPSGSAPNNNIDVPINASDVLQEKQGSLSVNTFVAHGDSLLKQGVFFRGPLKGIDPNNSDPTLKIGGTASDGSQKQVVASVSRDLVSGKTIGATDLKNGSMQRLCSDTTGHVQLCGSAMVDTVSISPAYGHTLYVTGIAGFTQSTPTTTKYTGTHTAFTGTIRLTTQKNGGPAQTSVILRKNGVKVGCTNITATPQTYTFSSETYAQTDTIDIVSLSNVCQ